jgi:hypothetical protein
VSVGMEFALMAAIVGLIVLLYVLRNRAGARSDPLHAEIRAGIQARACFETPLSRVRVLGAGGFEGTRGMWISLRGPKRLTVGTDAFMVYAAQARHDYVFTGRESSIELSQAPSRLVNQDWIVITGPDRGRQVQLGITRDNLPEVWQALARTGVAQSGDPDIW